MKKNIKGQSLIELLIVMALTAIFLPALISGLTSSREGKAQSQQREEAYTLLKEGEEAVRIVRERNWDEIETNGNYIAQLSGSSYVLTPITVTPTPANGFTRLINIEETIRDANGNIALS